jgi:hypothetical protein
MVIPTARPGSSVSMLTAKQHNNASANGFDFLILTQMTHRLVYNLRVVI